MSERIGHLLTLVQFLIGYAMDCAATLRQHTMTRPFRPTMQVRFGTSDLARILIRIARGLNRAATLATQPRRHAASGHEIPTSAERALVAPSTLGNRSTTTADRRAAGRGAVPNNPSDDDLPSQAQIAPMIRRGTTGAIAAAICRDLGRAPGIVSQQQGKDVFAAIITFGGNLDRLFRNSLRRMHECVAATAAANAPLRDATIRDPGRAMSGRFAPA